MSNKNQNNPKTGDTWEIDGNPAFRLWDNYSAQSTPLDWEKDIWSSIGHFSSQDICSEYLIKTFKLKKSDKKLVAPYISSFILQAIEFHNSAKLASLRTGGIVISKNSHKCVGVFWLRLSLLLILLFC